MTLSLIYKFKGLLNALKNAEKIKQEKQTLSVSNPLDQNDSIVQTCLAYEPWETSTNMMLWSFGG